MSHFLPPGWNHSRPQSTGWPTLICVFQNKWVLNLSGLPYGITGRYENSYSAAQFPSSWKPYLAWRSCVSYLWSWKLSCRIFYSDKLLVKVVSSEEDAKLAPHCPSHPAQTLLAVIFQLSKFIQCLSIGSQVPLLDPPVQGNIFLCLRKLT